MKIKNAVMICNTDEDSAKERFYIETLVAEQVSGFIIAQTIGNEDYIQNVTDRGIPVVAVDREMKKQQIDTVITDNQAGAYSATERLISLGHRRIGIINSLRGLSTTVERFKGYKKALNEHKIDIDSQLIT